MTGGGIVSRDSSRPRLPSPGRLGLLGLRDLFNTRHAVLRNYPIAAHLRFLLEGIRPEMRQYFFEGDKDGMPFPRDKRAIVYQRAKGQLDKRPFGTQQDVYGNQFEWINHSLVPIPPTQHDFRVTVGGPDCKQPYSLSMFNVSAMSFGALSANAIRALNKGAKLGNFAHDTGEGLDAVVVGDDHVARGQRALDVVEGLECLACLRVVHPQAAGDCVGVEGVHRLAGEQHDVVGHVRCHIDAALAAEH